MSKAQDVMTNLLEFADIRINGDRPWDNELGSEGMRLLADSPLRSAGADRGEGGNTDTSQEIT